MDRFNRRGEGGSIFSTPSSVCVTSLAKNGGRHAGYAEADGPRVMKQSEITVRVVLGRGDVSDTVWTCDLSYDYVKINADYRS